MKHLLVLCALLLSLAACQKDASREVILAETPDGRAFHFMPIYENGVTDITITIAWPMSWAYTSGNNPAVPYIAAEALLSGGTDALAPQDVLELFNDKNAGGQLYVRPDHAIGELSFPKEHIDDVVSVASQMLQAPQFDPAWVDRIKQGFLANMARQDAQLANRVWNAARLSILGDGPLTAFLSLTDRQAIEDVTIEAMRRWHSETIVSDGMTIAVTGAISREDAGNAVDQLLSGLPVVQHAPPPKVKPDFSPKTVLLHLPDAEKTTLGFIGQLPPTSEGGKLTDLLALGVFAGPGSGPLYDAIRTELRASYGFQARFTNYTRDTRILFIAGEVETEKLAEATDVLRKTYETFRSTPDLTGLDDLRRYVAGEMAQNVSYVDIAARTILEFALDGQPPADTPRIDAKIDAILAKDVQERLLTTFPAGDSLIVLAASPDETALPGACVITRAEDIRTCP